MEALVFSERARDCGSAQMQPLHLVWIDGAYEMVSFQELAEYGRIFGITLRDADSQRGVIDL